MKDLQAFFGTTIPAVRPEYRWITADGTPLRPCVMKTVNAFCMVFNHFSGVTELRRKTFNAEAARGQGTSS